MRTRRGVCYHAPEEIRRVRRKRVDPFEDLPDDLVLSIFSKLSASANSPSDLISLLLTCKRFNGLGLDPMVLVKASEKCLGIRAKNWCDSSKRFLKRCVESGNLEACYILGMISFYCLGFREHGAALMAKAAIGRNAAALYSLAVIQFNGSGGGSRNDRDLRAGAALSYRAATCGSLDAMRELGHCLQDGYGVKKSPNAGRRVLGLASTLEYTNIVSSLQGHVANIFLIEWYQSSSQSKKLETDGLKVCSHLLCGRVETRAHEFRRCSVCSLVNYCSRACQALHWRFAHKAECNPSERD